MKTAVILLASAGLFLLLLALYTGYTQANARDRLIITHALIEWKLARQEADD